MSGGEKQQAEKNYAIIKNVVRKFIIIIKILLLLPPAVHAAYPSSNNYQLRGYGFGAGGEDNLSSDNYRINAITGETGSDQIAGSQFKLGAGLIFEQNSDVPPAPTLENGNNYYNKLHFIVNPGPNPEDTLFAIAVSTDNFVSDVRYAQDDNTLGAILGSEDYQTYAAWGGPAGGYLLGLDSATDYKIKVKALHGDFSETGFGPVASASTVASSLVFDIDASQIDEETDGPFSVSFGNLEAGEISISDKKIWVDFETNAENGGRVYLVGVNSGLASAHTGDKINSASGDLSLVDEGYGARGISVTQTSGGPLVSVAPYSGLSGVVGVIDTTVREIYSSSQPIVGGRASFQMEAKSSVVREAANDYTDTLTLVASPSY